MKRIGFLINPIAGMGGRVGLKGTDGVVAEAVRRGARPIAPERAAGMLTMLRGLLSTRTLSMEIQWLTCAGPMGADALAAAGFMNFDVVFTPAGETSNEDTITATMQFLATGVDIVVFCGGDGTARDIVTVTGKSTPVLGVPSGVKMYFGVFGVTPERTAEILLGFVEDRLSTSDVEILDLDEDRYRQGEWAVRLPDAPPPQR